VRWSNVPSKSLSVSGKAGKICSAAVSPLAWVMNAALLPAGVVALPETSSASVDTLGYPGLAAENVTWYFCASAVYPADFAARRIETMRLSRMSDPEAVEVLVSRLPHLTPADYDRLLRSSGRKCPPQSAVETAGPRTGLWSTREAPAFGSKPVIVCPRAEEEWRAWVSAGAPLGVDEVSFVVNRSLETTEPREFFGAVYGAGLTSLFDEEVARQRRKVSRLGEESLASDPDAALRDPSPILRGASVRSLSAVDSAANRKLLERALGDRAVSVRRAAVETLALRPNPDSVEALARALQDGDGLVREGAAVALARVGTREAAACLVPGLASLSHRGRFDALCVLAERDTEEACEALRLAFSDSDVHTRIAVIAAAGEAPKPSACLLDMALSDPDPWVRDVATRVRGKSGPP
jgi:hypothetical protein